MEEAPVEDRRPGENRTITHGRNMMHDKTNNPSLRRLLSGMTSQEGHIDVTNGNSVSPGRSEVISYAWSLTRLSCER